MAIYANMTQPRPTVSGLYSGRSGFGALGAYEVGAICQANSIPAGMVLPDGAPIKCAKDASGYYRITVLTYAECKANPATAGLCAGLAPSADGQETYAQCRRRVGAANVALCFGKKGSGVPSFGVDELIKKTFAAGEKGEAFDPKTWTWSDISAAKGTGASKSSAPAASTAIVALLGGAALWYAFSGKK